MAQSNGAGDGNAQPVAERLARLLAMNNPVQTGSASDEEERSAEQDHRLHLSRRAVWLAASFFAFFVPIDLFVTGYLIHAAVEAVALVLVLLAALMLRDPRNLPTAQLVATVAVALAIVVVIITGVAPDGVMVWLALFPPVPFYLGGLIRGLQLSAVFAVIVLLVLTGSILIEAPVGFSWIAVLNAGGALVGSTAIAFLYERSRRSAQRRLAAAANTDLLTGVANRRGFAQGFETRHRLARRARQPLSVLVFDLDNLKPINDAKGHAAGDAAIRHVAAVVGAHIRDQDQLGRIGGDEFALVLPDTDLDGALTLAGKLRAALAERPLILGDGPLALTLSIGAAAATDLDRIGFDHLLAAADRRLYRVKQRGRNGQCGVRLPG